MRILGNFRISFDDTMSIFRSSASLGGEVIAFRPGGALYRALFLGGKSSVPGGVELEGDGLGRLF